MGDPRERAQELGAALRDYELLTVPVDRQHTRAGVLPRNRFFLLRRADLGLAPVLHVGLAGHRLRVDVEHSSHEQIVDLRVQIVARDGELWSLRPTGEAAPDPTLISRSSILLFPTGMRRIELLNVSLPSELDPTEIRAVLLNPGAQSDVGFGPASTEVVVPVL
jgi:hypothetical protein